MSRKQIEQPFSRKDAAREAGDTPGHAVAAWHDAREDCKRDSETRQWLRRTHNVLDAIAPLRTALAQ